MTTGEKIATLRKGKNITQEQLAELLGVTRQSVSRWEMDLAFPETEKLIRLSKLFSCSIDFLLNDIENINQGENTHITVNSCVSFILECGYFFLATSVEAQPKIRPLGMICTDGEALFIITDIRKSVCSDLEQNQKVTLASFNPINRKWLRISGTAHRDEQLIDRELVLTAYPALRQKYSGGQDAFMAIYKIHIEGVEFH